MPLHFLLITLTVKLQYLFLVLHVERVGRLQIITALLHQHTVNTKIIADFVLLFKRHWHRVAQQEDVVEQKDVALLMYAVARGDFDDTTLADQLARRADQVESAANLLVDFQQLFEFVLQRNSNVNG